ncbi:MAG TPA: phosphotransferase [Vicinamibacterales bacterium]
MSGEGRVFAAVMQQVLHLLIVDTRWSQALVAQYGSRWLLPILTCGERVRADPKALLWAASRGVECEIVGQWLGRAGPSVTDWLMAMSAIAGSLRSCAQLGWTPLEQLNSRAALVEYQGWALDKVVERGPLPSRPGPFGRFGWTAEVKRWIEAVIATPVNRVVRQFRSTPNEVVLCATTGGAKVFFKGMGRGRELEPRLTAALASLVPGTFASTIALEERGDGTTWWLTENCPGRPATDAAAVARALAAVQQQLTSAAETARHLPVLNLDAAVAWGASFLDEGDAELMRQHVQRAACGSSTPTWIPLDLHPTNVLVDDAGAMRFIDLDESFLGPPALAAVVLSGRWRDRSVYAAFERSWAPSLRGVDWPALEMTATLVDIWLGWRRLERITATGEVSGALELAAPIVADRLRRCIHRM